MNTFNLIVGPNILQTFLTESEVKAAARYLRDVVKGHLELLKLNVTWTSLSQEAKLDTLSRVSAADIDLALVGLDLQTVTMLRADINCMLEDI